LMLAT